VRATAIIPVKRFRSAKRRLTDELGGSDRAALARAMLTDVLGAVCEADSIERVVVVTGDRRGERIAMHRAQRATIPIEVLRDPVDSGHSEAATLGIVRAKALGAECAALLPGDCPLLDPADLVAAIARMTPARVAVIPDRHGTGTNGLLLAPVDAIGPAFGPGSRERHVERAAGRGLDVVVEELPSLALDVDTPDDLEVLRVRLAQDGRGATTAAELEAAG
jgi:2-phospho-L-lactate guanylyltransferase